MNPNQLYKEVQASYKLAWATQREDYRVELAAKRLELHQELIERIRKDAADGYNCLELTRSEWKAIKGSWLESSLRRSGFVFTKKKDWRGNYTHHLYFAGPILWRRWLSFTYVAYKLCS